MANTLPGTPYVESSDLVANYPAVSESLAERVDLVGILPFATSTARGTALPTPTDGQFSYLQDSNSTQFWNGSAWESLGGKLLQVVRDTDTTQRTTTSTTNTDITGLSITITPKQATSNIILLFSARVANPTNNFVHLLFTDSANTGISGAEDTVFGDQSSTAAEQGGVALMGFDTPGSTASKTYKVRWRVDGGTATLYNNINTAQIIAIEVAA